MNLFVNLKSAGRRRPALTETPYTVPDGVATLRQLLEAIVRQEADLFNSRGADAMLVPFLTETQMAHQAQAGKVGFGRLYSDRKADPQKSVEAALLGFEDGLFRVLINGRPAVALDEPLDIKEGDVLTFIRLTFLAGRLW